MKIQTAKTEVKKLLAKVKRVSEKSTAWSHFVILQLHLKVVDGNLVLSGVADGHRFENSGVVAFSLQQLAQLLEYSGTVGRNSCITSQVSLGNASKAGKQLLCVWVLCEQTERKSQDSLLKSWKSFEVNL